MLYCIFDTETTGLVLHPLANDTRQPRVIEFAALLVDGQGNEIDELVTLINPQIIFDGVITEITGITNEDVRSAKVWSEKNSEIFSFISRADTIIAHNAPFDCSMVELEQARLGQETVWPRNRICTVQEHAEEWGYRPKLTELYEHYTGEPLEQTHRALDDVRALVKICKHMEIIK